MNTMEISSISAKICEVIEKLGLSDNANIDDQAFKEIFEIIDSLSLINFVVELENVFDIEFPDEFLLPENFTSLRILAEFIRDMKAG